MVNWWHGMKMYYCISDSSTVDIRSTDSEQFTKRGPNYCYLSEDDFILHPNRVSHQQTSCRDKNQRTKFPVYFLLLLFMCVCVRERVRGLGCASDWRELCDLFFPSLASHRACNSLTSLTDDGGPLSAARCQRPFQPPDWLCVWVCYNASNVSNGLGQILLAFASSVASKTIAIDAHSRTCLSTACTVWCVCICFFPNIMIFMAHSCDFWRHVAFVFTNRWNVISTAVLGQHTLTHTLAGSMWMGELCQFSVAWRW